MKKATATKLDKWFQSHAPSFVALGAPARKVKTDEIKDDFIDRWVALLNSGRRDDQMERELIERARMERLEDQLHAAIKIEISSSLIHCLRRSVLRPRGSPRK